MNILILNGPNLNLLGIRQPEVYGTQMFAPFLDQLRTTYPDIHIEYYQSNVEGEIINKIQEVGFSYDGIILNAGGYSHTSVAIHDAIAAVSTPTIEVHISNIYAREAYRRHSLLSDACRGVICGMGMAGYRYALENFIQNQ